MVAKKLLAVLTLCVSFTLNSPAFADDKQDASGFANRLGQQSLEIISNASLSKPDKEQKLEAIFEQNVDIDWIGQFVLGRFWRTASDEQKQQYLANYRTFTIKHYTTNLSDFTNTHFDVVRTRPDDNGGTIVSMRIKRPQAEDVSTDFDIRPSQSGGLKVYDIVVEGVSMITTQRSEFNSVVSQKGLDYLIAQLKQRAETDPGVAAGAGQ